jgi:hypothetical protein
MLNQHQVGAHNLKVALKASDRLISKLEECPAPIAIRKPATRSTIPTCDPKARAPRKIFKGVKPSRRPHHNVPAPQHGTAAIRSAMPTLVTEQRNVNGALSPQRVPQRVIDMKLVARYLAK